MKYFVDGWTEKSNPSDIGGGFTIVDKDNNLVDRQEIKKVGFTNNEAELLGCYDCLNRAKVRDTIFVDSKVIISWITNPLRTKRARQDLDLIKLRCRKVMKEKKIKLVWVPRDKNLAGLLNEKLNK